MRADDVRSRLIGGFIGVAVGDALGAPVEFARRGSFPRIVDFSTVAATRLPPGAFTDDTAMTLCLADSLLADPHLNERDLLRRFCRWRDEGAYTSTGQCVGIGQATLRALLDHTRTGAVQAAPRPRSDGNGALMRVIPAALRHFEDVDRAIDVARRQSLTTHASTISATCCAAYVTLAVALLQGEVWSTAIARRHPSWDGSQGPAVVPPGWWTALTADVVHAGGFVVDALRAAFWAVASTSSFEEAVIAAVNLGDDADTVGAIAGGLAGCRYGEASIPARWRGGLINGHVVEDMAARLADAALSPSEL